MEISFYAYILKSAFCLSIFYLCYRLWLSKETFYKFNRFLLLGLLLTAFIIPTLQVSHNVSIYKIEQVFRQLNTQVVEVEKPLTVTGKASVAEILLPPVEMENADLFTRIFTVNNLWILYCLGILFGISRYIGSIICIYRLIRRSEKRLWKDDIHLAVHQQNIAPFSWGKYIVLSQQDLDEYGTEILAHEQAHIDHKHYFDLLLVDICCLFQWFNPMVWLFKSELKAIHEYEADESVLKEGIDMKNYQLLLIKKAVGTRLYSMANNLSHNSLKKRITMMLKERSNSRKLLKYFAVLPIMATTVALFARPNLLERESVNMNEMYDDTVYEDVLSNDTLNSGKIIVLKSYAESDTVQILKLDLQELSLSDNKENWNYYITSCRGNGVCEKARLVGSGNHKGELHLSSTVPWTPETLNNFTEQVKQSLLKPLGEISNDHAVGYSTSSEFSTAVYKVDDFFKVYRESFNYKEQLILLDGKEISYQQFKELSEADVLITNEVLSGTTNLRTVFGERAENGIFVIISKKNPTYWSEFRKKIAQVK
ncbi:M56 family metallopeptidase [Bacteroides sp.]|uniref:M56 family metallopeptidase n=1 Tax=Bacteroides sp. TaxID=29523 RepID=UPI00262B99A1|nr:M56 family metallopeptidase [Bacteroides sp.]MDD3038973.1 M56 family metallopeptidase [Bacteroides sp.]